MGPILRSLQFGLLLVALFGVVPRTVAQDAVAVVGWPAANETSNSPFYGPGDVYANIPKKDDRGRDQITMFREWNPDPLGNHEANLRALNPLLARVVRKAQADSPGLRFVIGSGKRDGTLQRKAVAWGWSRTRDSHHQWGDAVDLWPLDGQGHVIFEHTTQSRIGAAMKKAAAELQVPIRWGGTFRRFKDHDRSHFELASHPSRWVSVQQRASAEGSYRTLSRPATARRVATPATRKARSKRPVRATRAAKADGPRT
jgi:peptidoglycan L-alanyl-D-glutamate endopeptidase CwlK